MNPLNIQQQTGVCNTLKSHLKNRKVSSTIPQMIIHIDKEEVTILEIKIVTLGEKDTHAYNYRKDKKWIKFCREHNFHPHKDYNTKIYDLYLRLCAEGIIN